MSRIALNFQELLASMRAEGLRQSDRRTSAMIEARAVVATLKPDELEMLKHILAGWGKAMSAEALSLDDAEFEQTRAKLFSKINAASTTDAYRIGVYAELD